MFLVSRKTKAATAAKMWKAQYYNRKSWHRVRLGNRKATYDELIALGKSPTPEQVNEIIGNDGWTLLKCDECTKEVEEFVELGELPDYDSNTAYICLPCLKKALKLKS